MSETVTNLKVRFGADTKDFKKDLESGKAAVDNFSGAAGNAFGNFASIFGVNMDAVQRSLGTVKNSLSLLSGGLKGAATGSGFLTSALNILKLALVSTGIGAIVVILGAVVTAFTRFSDKAESVKVVMAGVGAGVDVLLDRFGKFGNAIIDVFKGDFSSAAQNLKETFTGIGDELKRDISLTMMLKRATIDLERESKVFDAQREAGMTEILRLRQKEKDITLSANERLKANIEANKIEEKLAERSLELANQETAATLDQINAQTKKLQLSKDAVDLIERIKKGTIGALEAQEAADNLDLGDKDGKESLFALIDAIVKREKEQQTIIQTRLRLQKSESSLRKEILSQEIEGIKATAELKEQLSKDDKRSLLERTQLILDAAELQRKALKIDFNANNISYEKFLSELDKLNLETEERIKTLRKTFEENSLTKFWEEENKKLQPIKTVTQKIEYKDENSGEKITKEIGFKIVTNNEGKSDVIKDFDSLFEGNKLEAQAERIKATMGDVKSVMIDATSSINEAFTNMAVGFGESLGLMLAGADGAKSIGTVVGEAFGNMAVQLGTVIAAAGVAFFALGNAFKAAITNPATALLAVAAGTALIAVGTAVKSSISNIGSGTYSGSAGGGSYDSSSYGGNSNIPLVPARSAPLEIRISGSLKGNGRDLVAVIENAQQVRKITT